MENINIENTIKEIDGYINFIKQKMYETTGIPNTYFKYNKYVDFNGPYATLFQLYYNKPKYM